MKKSSASFHPSSFPPHPSALRGDLDNIVLKALHKEAAQRYATVEQLSDDLQRHLDGEPVTARPATWRYHIGKYVQRHRAFVTMTSLLLLTLLTVAIVTASQLQASRIRERTQRYQLYAADMRQAGQAWAEGNLVQMDALLEAHRLGTGSDEWRGFEWFALWKLLHSEKFTLPHQAWVPAVLYTPDGKLLLTGSRDGQIQMWDARNGQSLGLFTTFPEGVYILKLSADGKKLAASGQAGLVKIWDFESRRVIAERPNHTDDQTYLTFSPNGQDLALTTYNHRTIEVWSAESGQRIAGYSLPSSLDFFSDGPPLYAPDGKLFCLARQDRRFVLWDIKAGRAGLRLDPHSDEPNALVPFYPTGYLFSPDGQRLYLPTRDCLTRVWDMRSGKLLHVFAGHQDNVETPALSSDGKLLATGSDDRTLRLWDTQTGQLLAKVRNESQTFSPVFSPDNKSLAAVCMRALRVKVWNVAQLLAEESAFTELSDFVLAPDGKTFLAEDKGRAQVMLCDLPTGKPRLVYSTFDMLRLNHVTGFSPDGRWLRPRVETTSDAVIIDTASRKPHATLKGHRLPILAAEFSPDGRTLATTGKDRLVKLWDTATWRERASWQGHTDKIWDVSFSPDSRKLATSSYDDTVRVWDAASGKELLTLLGHRAWVKEVKFSPDGKLIASASWDFTVKLWDAASGRELRTLTGHGNSVYAIAFSPDGKRLVSGGDDRTVRIWDVQTGEQLMALHGHTNPVTQVAFTPDGQTLLSSSSTEIRVWRTATEAEVRARQ